MLINHRATLKRSLTLAKRANNLYLIASKLLRASVV